jgi:putative PIN family toxin of toxin-antitoxin system
MRVLIDANVVISYLLNPNRPGTIRTIFEALFEEKFTLLLPEALLDEIVITVTQKSYLRARIPLDALEVMVESLRAVAEEIPLIESDIPQVTRDPKDDYLLAYALVGEADVLVSGNKDLLELGEIAGVRIMSPGEFVD